MKKILLSLTLLGGLFSASAQTLISENFNSLNAGALITDISGATAGQGGWYGFAGAGTPTTYANVVSVGANDNGLELTGSATTSGTRYVYKGLSAGWNGRTSGNNVFYAEYKMNTGATSTSNNQFRLALFDNKGYVIGGIQYTKSSKVVAGLAYDSIPYATVSGTISGTTLTLASATTLYPGMLVYGTGVTAATQIVSGSGTTWTLSKSSTISTPTSLGIVNQGTFTYNLGAQNAPVTLQDNSIYTFSLWYNTADSTIYWGALDAQGNEVGFSGVQQVTYTNKINELDIYVRPGTGNASASSVIVDDLFVIARPCLFYDNKVNPSFSYSANSFCKQGSNAPVNLVNQTATGTFTASPAGLSINSTTGAINVATSTAGTYAVKFVLNNANTCSDSATVNVTIQDCAGLDENSANLYSVYPNPTSDVVNVSFVAENNNEGTITLMTSEGKVIETREVLNTVETFNVKELNSGIYFLNIETSAGRSIEKVTIK